MVSIFKFQTKPNAFVLVDLDFFDKKFVEVRVPPGACVIKMWLYQCIA